MQTVAIGGPLAGLLLRRAAERIAGGMAANLERLARAGGRAALGKRKSAAGEGRAFDLDENRKIRFYVSMIWIGRVAYFLPPFFAPAFFFAAFFFAAMLLTHPHS